MEIKNRGVVNNPKWLQYTNAFVAFIYATSAIWGADMVMAKPLIDSMKHKIGQVNSKTWDGKISKFRSSNVFSVLFYEPGCTECKTLIDGEYNELAKNMQNIVGVLAIDCSEDRKFCKDQSVSNFPSVIIFPPFPIPHFEFKGAKTYNDMAKALRPLIPSQVKPVGNQKELGTFILGNVQVPKILFFSDKAKKPPVLVKSLSNAFTDKLLFAFLPAEEFPGAVKQYKVTKFPAVVVVRKDKKDEVYKGNFEFQPLFDWLNVFSETFVMGGGFSDTGISSSNELDATKQPWKFETVPELTKLSQLDLCFKKSIKHLCVIFAKKGRKLTEDEQELMESLASDYSGNIRGPDFKFMWIDLETEKEFSDLVQLENMPSVVIFNPYKRVRFVKLSAEKQPTKPNIRMLLEAISNGDARFKIVPADGFPKFADRKDFQETGKTDKKDEL